MLHYVSVGILSFFLLELSLLMYVYRKAFFVGAGSFWMKTDFVVVSISLILQLALYDGHEHGEEPGEHEADLAGLAGLLILVRLPWRVIRIAHAVIVTLEKAHQEGEAEGREEEGAVEHGLEKKLDSQEAALENEVAREEGLQRQIAELTRAKRGLEESNAALALENCKLQEALTKLGRGPAILLTDESVEVGAEIGAQAGSARVSRVESMSLDSGDERARRGSLNG